jgi:hypothetical protein
MKKLEFNQIESLEIAGRKANGSHVAGCVLGVATGIIGIATLAGGPLTFGLYMATIGAGLSLGAGLGECSLI